MRSASLRAPRKIARGTRRPDLVPVFMNTTTSAGGPDTCVRIRGDTQGRQPSGLAAVSATGAVPRSRWRRRGGSPIADPRWVRVRSGPRRSPLCFITRRFAPRTMLTGIAFVVAPCSRGRRARRIRGPIYEHEYLVPVFMNTSTWPAVSAEAGVRTGLPPAAPRRE